MISTPTKVSGREIASELNVPMSVDDHGAALRGPLAKFRGKDAERLDWRLAVGHPQIEQ